jgi:glycosyltransferase involved in cell wall biosynthesis
MFLSVALCTYNGERYLPDQLASISAQTRLPDELIWHDDCSTDGTVALARLFADSAPFPVHLVLNEANQGSTPSFARAIQRCQGDVIALADQDDDWLPGKLAALARALEQEPAAGLAFSNATVVDQDLRPLGYTLWDAVELGRAELKGFRRGAAFESLLRLWLVTGATLAFRSKLRDLVLPIPAEWLHDAWISLLIAAVAPLIPLAEPLLQYRQHPAQQIGGLNRGLVAQYRVAREMGRTTFWGVVDRFTEALVRLQDRPEVPPGRLKHLEDKVGHARLRAQMRDPGTWRLPLILGEVWRGRYWRYSRGWKAIAQDLFLP